MTASSNLPMQTPGTALKVFNQNLLDIHDPTDFAGVQQSAFSVALTYSVDKQLLPKICDELYNHVFDRLQAEAVGKVTLRTTDYIDSRYQGREHPRKYIVVESNTNRGTRSSIFVRFLPFGDNLYVGVDSYVLGSLDWFSVIIRTLITLVPLALIILYLFITTAINTFTSQFNQFGSQQSSGPGAGFFCCCFIPFLAITSLLWIDVIRAFRQHGDLLLALRQTSSNVPNNQSFNVDDVLMFFKSALPLVVFSVRDVFQRSNLPIQSLDDFVASVNNVVNISSGGGVLSIIGSAIGGRNNNVRP